MLPTGSTGPHHFARALATICTFVTCIPLVRLLVLRRRGPILRVITLHNLRSEDAPSFERMILFLRRRFNVITPDALEDDALDRRRVNVLLTFDDGYHSWKLHALPVLEQHDVKPIFFLSSGFIETNGDQEEEATFCRDKLRVQPKAPLSWAEVQELAECGVIGGHTVNHADLKSLSTDALEREIEEDKRLIEQRLQSEIVHFAYPFGMHEHVDQRAVAAVQSSGYRYAFTSVIDFADRRRGDLSIPRTAIDPDMALWMVYLWIIGSYDPVRRIVEYVGRALGERRRALPV